MKRFGRANLSLVWYLVSIGLGFGLAMLVALGLWYVSNLAQDTGLGPVFIVCRILAWAIAIPACMAAICALIVPPLAAWGSANDD